MSNLSGYFAAKVVDKYRKKNEDEGNRKKSEFSTDRFECGAEVYTPIFVICGFFFALITIACVVGIFVDYKDSEVGVFFFGIATLLTFFAAWATAHHKLIVDGNDATYINVWGVKKTFHFSEVTKCLTSEQSLRLYIEDKKVARLDKDMYCIDLLMTRCKKDGIEFRSKSRAGITKFTLVWHATRTLAIVFFWTAIGVMALGFFVRVNSVGFALSNLVFILKIELLVAAFFGIMVVMLMLYFAIGLKEVRSIEKALDLSFREEMAKRGAIGREYQDEEWFVESIPGKIEVLNRRFIKHWLGIKAEGSGRTTVSFVEFIDINGKKRKIGGHYYEHAEKMNKWFFSGK